MQKCPGWAAIAAALAVPLLSALPAAAEWVDWIADADVGFQYDSNVNNAGFGSEEEYDLIWEQLLAVSTKMAYAEQGQGEAEFSAFLKKHRTDIAKTLHRMQLEIATNQLVMTTGDNGVLVCRFWPQIAPQFTFKHTAMVFEGFELKLFLVY